MDNKNQIKHLLVFVPSLDIKTWHRTPLLTEVRKELAKESIKTSIFTIPQSILLKPFKPKSKLDTLGNSIYTIAPVSLFRRIPFLQWLFVTLPLLIQIKCLTKGSSHALWISKPNQSYLLRGIGGYSFFELYDNYLNDTQDNSIKNHSEIKQFDDTLRRSNIVLVSNHTLYKELEIENKLYFPNAVSSDFLVQKKQDSKAIPNIDFALRLGFVGAITSQVDFELIFRLADKRKDWLFLFIGRIDQSIQNMATELQLKAKNIQFTGSYKYEELPTLLSSIQIGLCTYTDSDFNKYRNPMKLYEYSSYGIPTIVTGCTLDEQQQQIAYVCTGENIMQKIETAVSEATLRRTEFINFAKSNIWSQRAATIAKIILLTSQK